MTTIQPRRPGQLADAKDDRRFTDRSLASDLLPWADPYIAQLCEQHQARVPFVTPDRRQGSHRIDGGRFHQIRNEAPPPLGETPFRFTDSGRRNERPAPKPTSPKPTAR